MRSRRQKRVVVVLAVILLAGCSPDLGGEQPTPSYAPSPTESGGVLSVAEALTAEKQSAEVRGYILAGADRVTRLCTGLAASYPPQCGMPALTVKGLRRSDIPNSQSNQGITWSGETTLRGALSGGVLTVS